MLNVNMLEREITRAIEAFEKLPEDPWYECPTCKMSNVLRTHINPGAHDNCVLMHVKCKDCDTTYDLACVYGYNAIKILPWTIKKRNSK